MGRGAAFYGHFVLLMLRRRWELNTASLFQTARKRELKWFNNGLKDTQLVFSLLKSHIHFKKCGGCNFTFFRLLGVTSPDCSGNIKLT